MYKRKIVVILSGGLDSTTLLYYAKSMGEDVKALSFNYGQRHEKELSYAMRTTAVLEVDHSFIDISKAFYWKNESALLRRGVELPHGHYTDESQKITIVPGRNLIMLAVAASYAEIMKFDIVCYAVHKNDYAIYPDCRPTFVNFANQTIQQSTDGKVQLVAPFVNRQKYEIVLTGYDLGVDFSKTWSCYEGEYLHCGKCATCQERIEAFKLAKIEDPTEYQSS